MPDSPPRFSLRPVPFGKRRSDDGSSSSTNIVSSIKFSRQAKAISSGSGGDLSSIKQDAPFTSLIADFLEQDPLPFIKKKTTEKKKT
jgi:hypothetical protein